MNNYRQFNRVGTFCETCRQVMCLCETEKRKEQKPIKAKPHFYSVCLEAMQQIAKDAGYNLLVHGSMNRDLDLVAVAWVDEPKTHIELLDSFCEYLGVPREEKTESNQKPYLHSVLGGGRDSYVINLNRGGKFNGYLDVQYYLDISFTPNGRKN